MYFPISLRPLHPPRIVFCLEMFVAFGPTKTEDLAIIPDKHEAMSRVDGARTKVALFDSHFL